MTISVSNSAQAREVLAAPRTYYVRPDGSDSNNGLANTAGGAFLTFQRPYDVICSSLDLGGQAITISISSSTAYSAGVSVTQPWTGGGSVTYTGDTTTPANVTLSMSGTIFSVSATLPGSLKIEGTKWVSSGGRGLDHSGIGKVVLGNNNYGTIGDACIFAESVGAVVNIVSGYTISGNQNRHVDTLDGGLIQAVSIGTVTLTSTPAIAWFAQAQNGGNVDYRGVTFSGGATGTRFNTANGGLVNSGGGGANYYPGNVAGTGTNFGASPYGMYI